MTARDQVVAVKRLATATAEMNMALREVQGLGLYVTVNSVEWQNIEHSALVPQFSCVVERRERIVGEA